MTKKILTSMQMEGETVAPVAKKETKRIGKRTEWTCKVCHIGVILHVRPAEPPSHACRKANNKTKQLTLKGESNE
jgi:hypothetical protein